MSKSKNNLNVIKATDNIVTDEDVKSIVKSAFDDNCQIVDHHLKPYSDEKLGFLGVHSYLVITTRSRNNVDELRTFFVKSFPSDNEEQAYLIENSYVFFKEINFYKYVLPELLSSINDKSWVAQCHLVKDDAIVLEDLKARNFQPTDMFFDTQHLHSALTGLAKLHAASMLAEKRLGKSFDQIYGAIVAENHFNKSNRFYKFFLRAVDVHIAIAKHIGLDGSRIPEVFDRIFEKVLTSKTRRNVICHGDAKAVNIMFDQAKPLPNCVLVDFQLIRYAPPMIDVSQLLYHTTRREFRDKNEEKLLRFYYETLERTLEENGGNVKLPKFEEFQQEYEELRVTGLVTAAMNMPLMLLEKKKCAEMTKDSDGYAKLVFEDRSALVLDNMRSNPLCNDVLTEITTEMVQRSSELLIL